MKVTVSKLLFNKAVQAVSRIIESKSPIPVLNGLKIEVNTSGMTVVGCDSEMIIEQFIPIETDEKQHMYVHSIGQGVLHAQVLNEYIKKITVDEIEIEVDEKFQGKVIANKTDLKINGFDPQEFPNLPQFLAEQSFTVSSQVLTNMIRQTIFAVSTNEQSPILTGVFISLQQGKLKFIATDRHRLAAITHEIDSDAQFQQLVVSSKALNELSKLLPDEDVPVEILFKDNQVLFKFDNTLLYAKLLDGTYPDTEKIIQNSANYTTELIISTDAIMATMERALILSRKEKGNVVKMYSLDDETIEIFSSSSELGKFKESLSTRKPLNNAIRVSFNSKFMLDVLKVMDSEYVIIGFSGDMNPIFIRPEETSDAYESVHLILPFRTAREDA
jgi:DNA polymerase-3 subunit beta